MTEPVRFFNAPSAAGNGSDTVKTYTVCLFLLIPLLGAPLALGLAHGTVARLILAMIGLVLVVLVMTRTGLFRFSVPVLTLGLALLGSAAVFALPRPSPHTVYMLCTFHLSLLFIAALISYNRCYLYLSCTVALVSFALFYHRGAGATALDDLLICSGLLIISTLLIGNTLAARKRMFNRLCTTSRENADRAAQLASLNRDLQQAVDQREEMAEKYRLLLETATDAILIAQDGMIRFCNGQTLDLFGFSREELTASPFTEIVHPDDRELVIRRHRERLSGGSPPSAYTFRALDKAGNTLWLQIHTVVTLWEGRPATLNFIQDITSHKLMEQQIQQSQKMEAIGTLAGGIAHDFNNILTGIFAYLQLAGNHAEAPEKLKQDLHHIRQGADKAADLCRQILLISRKSEPRKEPVSLTRIVREVTGLMQATLPAGIQIRESLETGALILANPGKLHQVVLNLCTNAFQAMAETGKGTLDISLAKTVVFQDPGLDGRGIRPGEYLCLTVKDTGHGMDLETQARLFDPYFTTKPAGKGTGLGLAVALGIIEDHQGYVRVFSQKGKGSEFQVFFPSIQDSPQCREGAGEESAPCPRKGRLLLVEDEAHLRQALAALLENQGYQVVCAQDGQQALDRYTADGTFDLVMSDEILPAMTGTVLLERIKTLSPATPVILFSGNTRVIADNCQTRADAFIPKPLDMVLMGQTIHDLIRARVRSG